MRSCIIRNKRLSANRRRTMSVALSAAIQRRKNLLKIKFLLMAIIQSNNRIKTFRSIKTLIKYIYLNN